MMLPLAIKELGDVEKRRNLGCFQWYLVTSYYHDILGRIRGSVWAVAMLGAPTYPGGKTSNCRSLRTEKVLVYSDLVTACYKAISRNLQRMTALA